MTTNKLSFFYKYKTLFSILLLTCWTSYALSDEIILQKDSIVITSNDLVNYQKLYKDFFGDEVAKSTAIKNLYVIFKVVNNQVSINPYFINETDKIINSDLEKFELTYSNHILSYFLRYEILKKDFITSSIKNNNLDELDELILGELTLYNDVKCKIKLKSLKFESFNKSQKKQILNDILSEVIIIEKEIYLCLSDTNRSEISNIINNVLFSKGYEKFLQYVHKNIK